MDAVHQTVNEVLQFPLTDSFEENIISYLESHSEDDASITIALIDLDHLARINECFGRDIGEQIMIQTGRYLVEDLPESASIYRIAGDEFGIVFKGVEKEEVFLLMEKKRTNYHVLAPDDKPMSFSTGVAAAFDDASRYQELVRKAESAMFRAKYSGRNKVALAREEKMVPKTSHYTSDQLKRLSLLSKKEGIGEAILLREALDMLLKKYPN